MGKENDGIREIGGTKTSNDMIIYKTGGWRALIEPVKATRINEKSVWFYNEGRQREERQARNTSYYQYWETIDEAEAYIRDKFEKKIQASEKSIIDSKKRLEELDELMLKVGNTPIGK